MINAEVINNDACCNNLSNYTKENLLKMINNFLIATEKIFPTEMNNNKEPKRNLENAKIHGDFDSLVYIAKDYPKNKLPSLKNVCSRIARRLGFNISISGTKYLIEAILYVYENNIDELKLNIIYQALAQKYSVATSSIKSSINYSITLAMPFILKNKPLMEHIFAEYDGRIPNSKYLIALAVYELRVHLEPEGYDNKRIEKILFYA